MLKRTLERLKKRSEFLAVAKTGDKWITPGFILQIYKKDKDSSVRIGITASRKVGGAVERNRAKRRLRALICQIFPTNGSLGADYVLIARTECLKRNFALMGKELEKALLRLHERV